MGTCKETTPWKYRLYVYVMLFRPRFTKRLLCLLPIIAFLAAVYFIGVARRHAPCKKMKQHDISCHFLPTADGDLPVFEGLDETTDAEELNIPETSSYKSDHKNLQNVIFFHETSCRGALTLRQACSVESAARAHPHWTVYVLFSAPFSTANLAMMDIDNLPNVRYRRVVTEEYVKDTPLEELVMSGRLNRSQCKFTHAADILRYATLFKHPGVYLDLDMIVVKPLDRLGRNFAVREDDHTVSSGALGLGGDEVGRKVAEDAAKEIATTFTHRTSTYNGPGVITRVLNRRCNTLLPYNMDEKKCKGFMVYGPEISNPISSSDSSFFFRPGRFDHNLYQTTYMYHFYDQLTRCYSPAEDSAFHKLAEIYCPSVYKSNPRHFGWIG